jgi:hypothetical protein
MPRDLHEQPGGIPAGAAAEFERLFGRLHARFEADRVLHLAVDGGVQLDEEVDGAAFERSHFGQHFGELRPARQRFQVRGEFGLQHGFVLEGDLLRVFLDEEIERVDRDEFGDEIDRHAQRLRRLGEDDPREVVVVRVLLPVQEVRLRLDVQRIAVDGGARVRRRAQPDLVG